MDGAPWFDEPDLFDQRAHPPRRHRRLRHRPTSSISAATASRVYFNQTGNGWSDARASRAVPGRRRRRVDHGRRPARPRHGLPRLVVAAAGRAGRPLRYIDLMGGQKPHLLDRDRSTTSAPRRVIDYASSTKFYLADKAAGTPWVTRLPFPGARRRARRDLRPRQPQPLRHALQLSPRLLRRRRARVPRLRPGRPARHRGVRRAHGERRFPGRRQYRRGLERAAGADQDLVSHRRLSRRRPHLAAPGARILSEGAAHRGEAGLSARADPRRCCSTTRSCPSG